MDPFTDYQKIVHRTSDLLFVLKGKHDKESAIYAVLDQFEKTYSQIIADETYPFLGNDE